MPALCEVAMSAQYRVTTHEQPQTPQGGQRHPVQQRRQERPVTRSEPDSITVELAFEHGDLMAEGKELRILFRSLIGSRRSSANALVIPR
ncbi:MAG: hypothetical protein HOY76_46075 [Streptomyces sp.]|nr:hypothetical protein [Streptomyces sp.]